MVVKELHDIQAFQCTTKKVHTSFKTMSTYLIRTLDGGTMKEWMVGKWQNYLMINVQQVCIYVSVQELYIFILYVTTCEAHVIMYYNCCICILVHTHRNTHTMNLFENHHNPQIPEKVEYDGTRFPH